MVENASCEHPIHPLIGARWSPRSFSGHLIADEDVLLLLEAARWAPSSFNEQPWSFIIAPAGRPDEFAKACACLTAVNRRWADKAALLVFVVAHLIRRRDGVHNRYAHHDVGLAIAYLNLQATSQGLGVHIMGGFDRAQVQNAYHVPVDHEPLIALAVGYIGVQQDLPEDLRERDARPRTRKRLQSFVFADDWGEVAPEVGGER